jgi:hypothetical protein
MKPKALTCALALTLCAAGAAPAAEEAPPARPGRAVAEKPWPKTPGEAERLRKQGVRWSNAEIRGYYLRLTGNIDALNRKWAAQGLSVRQRARKAYEVRHNARMTCRAMMSSRAEVLLLRARDKLKYGHSDGPTFGQLVEKARKAGLRGDAVYESILQGAKRTNETVNRGMGF